MQGIAYYHNFLAHFPDIKALATAPEDDVLKVWQGLGYYSRARNMHAAAQSIMENHNGKFPHNYQEIRKLKGIDEKPLLSFIPKIQAEHEQKVMAGEE